MENGHGYDMFSDAILQSPISRELAYEVSMCLSGRKREIGLRGRALVGTTSILFL